MSDGLNARAKMSRMRATRAVLMMLLLAVTSCRAGKPTTPRGEALAIDASSPLTIYHGNLPDVALIYTAAWVTAREPVELVAVRPDTLNSAEVLAARVNFVGSYVGRKGVNGSVGNICAVWPVKGFGPTYPVRGLQLRAGESVAIVVFAKGTAVGHGKLEPLFNKAGGTDESVDRAADGVLKGLTVEYKVDGRRMNQKAGNVTALFYPRQKKSELFGACKPSPSVFIGDANTGERFKVSSGGATSSP